MFYKVKTTFIAFISCLTIFSSFGQSTVYLTPVQDAPILNISGSNYGSDVSLGATAGPFLSTTAIMRTLAKFDIVGFISTNNIPSNAVITSANLSFGVTSTFGTVNASSFTLRKITSSWTEMGVTYANQPTTTTANQVTTSTMSGFGGWSWRNFDVTQHITSIVRGYETIEGWCLSLTNEASAVNTGENYASKENTTFITPPQLTINYYIPFSLVSVEISNASSTTATDGSIFPVIANGSGLSLGSGSSFKWSKNGGALVIATTPYLTGQGYGWYGLEITGTLGDKFYYSFMIGAQCATVSIPYNPGPNYIDDLSYGNIIGGAPSSASTTFAAIRASHSTTTSLLRFRLWMPEGLDISAADLTLKGSAHVITTNNESIFLRNTQNWDEYPSYNLFYAPPATSTDITKIIPNQTIVTSSCTVSMIDFWNSWKLNNLQNFGVTFTRNNANQSSQVYHSSDAASSANYPSISFSLLGDCEDLYGQLKYELDGYYHTMKAGKLRFVFNQEYDAANLTFNIYNSNDVLVKTQADFPAVATTNGMNYLTLAVVGSPCLGVGFFYLEVINSKKEKMYLRFYNDYTACTP